jgi:hypothetical protein
MKQLRYKELLQKCSTPDIIELLELHEGMTAKNVQAVTSQEEALLFAGHLQGLQRLRSLLTKTMEKGVKI